MEKFGMKRLVEVFVVVGVLVVSGVMPPVSFGQEGDDDDTQPVFGAYREESVDLEVAVPGGTVAVHRYWDGDLKSWTFNPQHSPIVESEKAAEGTDNYEWLFQQELRRGTEEWVKLRGFTATYGYAVTKSGPSSSPTTQKNFAMSNTMLNLMDKNGVKSCQNEDPYKGTFIKKVGEGYKWINGIGHRWATYDAVGRMTAWGSGAMRLAQILYKAYDVANPRKKRIDGYADNNDREVIHFHYDAEGRVGAIEDLAGNKVQYEYNNKGRITKVTAADGTVTQYRYQNGQIIEKIIGLTGEVDDSIEEGIYTFQYTGKGRLSQMVDPDGITQNYSYTYDSLEGIFTKTVRYEGSTSSETRYYHPIRGLEAVQYDEKFLYRVLRICEDSVIKDQYNHETYFDRDGAGNLQRIIFPDGEFFSLEHTLDNWPEQDKPWDEQSKAWGIKTVTARNGTTVNFLRNRNGDVVEATKTPPNGRPSKLYFKYDDNFNQIEQRVVLDADAEPSEKDWLDRWRWNDNGQVETYTDAHNNQWHYTYNNLGDIRTIEEPNGAVTNFEYDAPGRLKSYRDPSGYQVHYTYNKRGLVKQKREVIGGEADAVTRYRYTKGGRLKATIDALNNTWTYDYDRVGRLRASIDPEGRREEWTYDNFNRPKTYTDTNGVTLRYDYFDNHLPGGAPQLQAPFSAIVRITAPTYVEEVHYNLMKLPITRIVKKNDGEEYVTKYEYDKEGHVTKVTAPDGRTETYTYDGQNRVIAQTVSGIGTTKTVYDDINRTFTTTDPLGNEIVQKYNRLGQVNQVTRADGTSFGFTYDPSGNIESTTSSNGILTWYSYDLAHRAKSVSVYPTGNRDATPSYQAQFHYSPRDELLSYTDNSSSGSFNYDRLGRMKNTTINYGPFSKSHSYTYTPSGLRETYTASDGSTYRYQWDKGNHLRTISLPSEGDFTISYTEESWPKTVQYPGGSKQSYEYDELGRPTAIHSEDPAGKSILELLLTYQPKTGLITKITNNGEDITYGYDAANRLTKVDNPTAPDENYTYNANGDRTTVGETWKYNKNGGLESQPEAEYTYDTNGNRATKVDSTGTTRFIYDDLGRLTEVKRANGSTIAKYGYGPEGERLWKEVNGEQTFFYYNEDGLAEEYNAAGTLIRSYLYEPDNYWGSNPIAIKSGGRYHYVHSDHLGAPRVLHTLEGETSWAAEYSAYGIASIASGAKVTNPLRFPGQYFDSETGLHQNFIRNYDPEIGAYLEQDPFGLVTGPNWYAYAGGNPLGFTDPTGEAIPIIAYLIAAAVIADRIYTGYIGYLCAEVLKEGACSAMSAESCQELALVAALPVVGHGLFKVLKWLGKSPWGRRLGRWVLSKGDDAWKWGRSLRSPKLRPDVRLSGGRGGTKVKNLVGPPNSVVKGGNVERAFVTDGKGRVILDINSTRVKPVRPGVGFGPKRSPSPTELDILDDLFGLK